MATRMIGKTKLTAEIRQRLVEVARELGYELMRLLMEQTNTQQAQQVPNEALQAKSNEVATPIGVEDRTLETEAGAVSWKEPKAYLPKSRKAFLRTITATLHPPSSVGGLDFFQSKALGLGVDEELSPSVMREVRSTSAGSPRSGKAR